MELKFRVAEDAVRLRFEVGGSVPAPEPSAGDNSVQGLVEAILLEKGAFAEDCICGIAEPIEEG